MKYILFILFSSTLCFASFGQYQEQKYTVSGQVIDDQGVELPYVSVGVFNEIDSSYVGGTATDIDGRFMVKVIPGKYYVKISFLSFEDNTVDNISIKDKNVDLKKISLKPAVNNLEEFELVAEKKLMQLDLDKRVFNVGKDVTNQGADASEILDNVPSVSVDVDGNVSLRGSGNVRILINGKPSGLTGISTSEALKQLQGNQIEKIEVITNPSSRYEAEGEVGIINIILKKDRREGVNGSVNVDFGYPKNYGGGFNLTVKKKKYSVFTGYGMSFRDSPGSTSAIQQFNYPDTAFSYSTISETNRFRSDHNFRLGTEIFINEYNSLVISSNYSIGDGDNETNLTYSDFDASDAAVQTVNRDEIEDKDYNSYDVSLNYRKTFKQKDRLLTFDIQQSQRTDDESSTISQTNSRLVEENTEQRAFNDESSFNWLFQTDYIHPIKGGKLEFGLRSSLKEIEDDYGVEQLMDSSDTWEFIPGFVNRLVYNENVSAAYAMFGKKVDNFSYQLGVRAEYSDITTNLTGTNEVNARDYFNLFPSAHFSYELLKENSLQLSYSRRIQRPRHFYLLPFFSFSDTRNTFSGNPNLDPEYTNSYEVGHLKDWGNASLLSSVYYRATTGTINWITFSDEEGITQRNPINLGTRDAFGVEFSGSYKFAKWWDLRGSFNFYRVITEGEYLGVQYDTDDFVWSTRMNSKWTIKKKVNLQTSVNYRAAQESPQGITKARYSVDAGFSFDLLKGNGTMSFNVKDLFNTRNRRSISYGENFVSESERQWRSRYFRVSFTYRINQKKKRGGDRNFGGDGDGGGIG